MVTYLPWLLLLAFQSPPTFTSQVNLVHVEAEVREDERLIEGLRKQDFRIEDNGEEQEILYLGNQEEPLDIILLLDTSISMRPVIERIADAASASLGQLQEGDRIALMTFDREPHLVVDFTSEFAEVERLIRERVLTEDFGTGTRIQKAVDAAARHFLEEAGNGEERRRRAILVVTDNLAVKPDRQALRDLWEADAVLSGIVVRHVGMRILYNVVFPPSLFGMGGINGLVEKTGGITISLDDAGEGLQQMIQRLRHRYSLYYAMPAGKPGEERKVKVELEGDAAARYRDAKVRARSGYRISE